MHVVGQMKLRTIHIPSTLDVTVCILTLATEDSIIYNECKLWWHKSYNSEESERDGLFITSCYSRLISSGDELR